MYMQICDGRFDSSNGAHLFHYGFPPSWSLSSRAEKLVALLATLQTLHTLGMHLLGHLFVASLFFLGGTLVLDTLNMRLYDARLIRSYIF